MSESSSGGRLGTVAAVAGVISAIVAVMAYADIRSSDAANPQSVVTTPAGTVEQGQAIAPVGIPSASEPKLRWSGEIMANNEFLDLDASPPKRSWSVSSSDVKAVSLNRGTTAMDTMPFARAVKIPADFAATAKTCADKVHTYGTDDFIDVEPGTRICLGTEDGRTVLIEVTAVDNDQTDFFARAIVWEK